MSHFPGPTPDDRCWADDADNWRGMCNRANITGALGLCPRHEHEIVGTSPVADAA